MTIGGTGLVHGALVAGRPPRPSDAGTAITAAAVRTVRNGVVRGVVATASDRRGRLSGGHRAPATPVGPTKLGGCGSAASTASAAAVST